MKIVKLKYVKFKFILIIETTRIFCRILNMVLLFGPTTSRASGLLTIQPFGHLPSLPFGLLVIQPLGLSSLDHSAVSIFLTHDHLVTSTSQSI